MATQGYVARGGSFVNTIFVELEAALTASGRAGERGDDVVANPRAGG